MKETKILCLTGSGLGDTCMAMPAIKHLAARYSGLKIVLACAYPEIANVAPWIDHVIDIGVTRLKLLSLLKIAPSIRKIRQLGPYHLAVSFSFHPIRQAYLLASGADHLLWSGDGLGYRGDIANNLVGACEPYAWYPNRKRQDYICIHPFTRKSQGSWGCWQRLIFDLNKISPVNLVGQGRHVFQFYTQDLIGMTTLKEVFEIIARARMVVTADTAIMHIATATNTPCVALYARTSPTMASPHNGNVKPVYIPCEYAEYYHRASRKSQSKLSEIQYEKVLELCHTTIQSHPLG